VAVADESGTIYELKSSLEAHEFIMGGCHIENSHFIGMLNEISALEIMYIIKEIKPLEKGKIDKIYQPENDELILQIHASGEGKKLIKIVCGKYLCLTSSKSSSEQPKSFCMLLRKYLENAKIKEIKQIGFERIVQISIENKEGIIDLFFEFFDKGNMILVKDGVIIAPLQQQIWKERTIKPKEVYKYPKKDVDITVAGEKDIGRILENSKQEKIVKTLATEFGLGGVYAEEVCLIAGIDKNEKPNEKVSGKITDALKEILNKKIEARVYYKDGIIKNITPFGLIQYEDLKKEEFSSFSEAIDIKIKESKQKKTSYDKEIQKFESIIQQQEQQIANMERNAQENAKKGEKIYENYQLIEEVIKQTKEAKKKHSLKELKEKIKGNKLIKSITEKGEIIIDI